MLENLKSLFKKKAKEDVEDVEVSSKSKEAAKERLHLVLMQDRANVSVDFLEMMKQEIIDVIKKYIDVDENEMDVRLTNKINKDGTNGAPALYANIPIISIKTDTAVKKVAGMKISEIKDLKKIEIEEENNDNKIKSNSEINNKKDIVENEKKEKKSSVTDENKKTKTTVKILTEKKAEKSKKQSSDAKVDSKVEKPKKKTTEKKSITKEEPLVKKTSTSKKNVKTTKKVTSKE